MFNVTSKAPPKHLRVWICICIYIYICNLYIYICMCVYIYDIYIYICLYGHTQIFALPLGYLLFLAFRHVQNLHPLQHFVCSVNMKVAYRCSFSTFICHLHWYLQHLLLFIIRGSCSLKSSFLSCSFCVSQVT